MAQLQEEKMVQSQKETFEKIMRYFQSRYEADPSDFDPDKFTVMIDWTNPPPIPPPPPPPKKVGDEMDTFLTKGNGWAE